MTPETRAARDRISAACDEAQSVGTKLATAYAADLRTVLAALDEQPAWIIATETELTEEDLEEFRRKFRLAQLDGKVRVLDTPAGATEWGEPETQWTLGVHRPDGSHWVETHREREADVRRRFDEMVDTGGYRKALLRREATAWREADNPETSDD